MRTGRRRAGLHPICLPQWRRQAREGAPAMPDAGGADFVEVEVAAAPASAPDAGVWGGIVHGGTAIRLGGGTPAERIAGIVHALDEALP